MNAVGIDVSKGKSTVAIMRPYGEIVASPFEINHTEDDFKKLVSQIQKLHGESRIIMEYTGRYYEPLANYLYNAGLHVSVVNAILIHDYSNSSIRRVKTDNHHILHPQNSVSMVLLLLLPFFISPSICYRVLLLYCFLLYLLCHERSVQKITGNAFFITDSDLFLSILRFSLSSIKICQSYFDIIQFIHASPFGDFRQ